MTMTNIGITQPDVSINMDADGVIRVAEVNGEISREDVDAWLGRRWAETVVFNDAERVEANIALANEHGLSAFQQFSQRFPSGIEVPIEYTTVRLNDGLLAIGKNLEIVTELQSRLISAQKVMERDYWKLRDIETRYRLLFDASLDAVIMINASDLHIVEANPSAIRSLGIASAGRDFLQEVSVPDRDDFSAMLGRVRETGKAPAIQVRIGRNRVPWLVRASMMTSEHGHVFLLQLTATGGGRQSLSGSSDQVVNDIVERLPDAFAVVDVSGTVLRANKAFLELVQVANEVVVRGSDLGQWLERPGADVSVLLAQVQEHDYVRSFHTTLRNQLDATFDVEVTACGGADDSPPVFGVLIRDSRANGANRGAVSERSSYLSSIMDGLGKLSFKEIVSETVEAVEQECIRTALKQTRGNRTAAANLLKLSRQSLHAKLNKYDLDRA